jgi:DNA sulfur modification protein DndE
MHDLQLRRLKFSKEADTWLKVMKSRTGITPNLLCRIGFCLSLEEPGIPPRPELYPEDSDREINRGTLLGEHDTVFVALLRQRLAEDGLLGEASLEDQFRAHIHRGVILLAGRMKTLAELGEQFSVPKG